MKRTSIIAPIALAAIACQKPHYTYEPRAATAPVDRSRCYESRRLELATGSFEWSQVVDSGYTLSPTGLGYSTLTYHGQPRYQSINGRGLIVRAGGERLDAVAALERLGDRELLEYHRRGLDLTAGPASRYPFYRRGAIGLIAVGTPITLVGAGLLLAIDDPAPGGYTAIAGLTMLAVGASLYLGSVLAGPDYARHERDAQLLVDPAVARRAADDARGYNRRVAAECGAAADLPMTDSARQLIDQAHQGGP